MPVDIPGMSYPTKKGCFSVADFVAQLLAAVSCSFCARTSSRSGFRCAGTGEFLQLQLDLIIGPDRRDCRRRGRFLATITWKAAASRTTPRALRMANYCRPNGGGAVGYSDTHGYILTSNRSVASQTNSNSTADVVPSLPGQSRWSVGMRALRHRNFQLFFSGQLISLVGTWMQTVAQSWLVYRLTGSSLQLGVVGFAGQIPVFLLAPIGGMVADRVNRQRW